MSTITTTAPAAPAAWFDATNGVGLPSDAAMLAAGIPQEVIDVVRKFHQAGAFQSMTIGADPKPAAAFKHVALHKSTKMVLRSGVNYSKMAANQGRQTGPLPFGVWAIFPYVITHNGEWYIRVYVNALTSATTYTVDGAEVDKDTFNSHLTPSAAKPKHNPTGCITPKWHNVAVS